MGSRAKTHIGNPPPISTVVDSLITRKGKIGDLVVMVASLTKSSAKHVILHPALVFSSLGKVAFGHQLLKGAILFY